MVRWFSVSILAASILHLTWATALLQDPSSQNATGLHALMVVVREASGDVNAAAVVLITVAVIASIAAFLDPAHRAVRTLMMLPQQFVLVISTEGVVEAMALRSFSDGVLRPFWFIVSDQIALVVVAIAYVITLSRVAVGVDWRPR